MDPGGEPMYSTVGRFARVLMGNFAGVASSGSANRIRIETLSVAITK